MRGYDQVANDIGKRTAQATLATKDGCEQNKLCTVKVYRVNDLG